MTDRELLEYAAKAAGHTLIWGEKYKLGEDLVDCTDLAYIRSGQPDEGDLYWNPLIDDGDALRLAVQLDLGIEVMLSLNETRAGDGDHDAVAEKHNGDPLAATRRAIVRAAAEIGRSMT